MSFKLNKHTSLGLKQGVEYWQDNNGIIFSNPIDQSGLVGGGHEEGRNTLENPERLKRVISLSGENGHVLDFGCGHGLLVKYLRENKIPCWGYDKFNPEFEQHPLFNSIDLIVSVECFEHLAEPFDEIDLMFNWLRSGGKIYVETSFSDWLTIESDYVNPLAGHNTIFSHKGLDELMTSKGFHIGEHINRNCRVYIKP